MATFLAVFSLMISFPRFIQTYFSFQSVIMCCV